MIPIARAGKTERRKRLRYELTILHFATGLADYVIGGKPPLESLTRAVGLDRA